MGTVDAKGAPATCRGIALAADGECDTATVYVPIATSQATVANIAATGRMAVVTTHPVDHLTTQFKGVARGVRLAHDGEAPFVRSRLDQFADVLDSLGLPRRTTRSVAHWPAFAIELRVDEIYEQTPGPKAGSRLR